MSEEANKIVVRRYFEEVLDGGNRGILPELIALGARNHFPGRDSTVALTNPGGRTSQTMHTDLHRLLADGDFVVAQLTHHVTYGDQSSFVTRAGSVDASNRSVSWDATAIFQLRAGKIVEWWVNRDELNVLMQLDAVILNSAR